MIMKQNVIVWMVLSLFLLGCSENDKVVYETENALLNQNNITDVVQVFQEVSQEEGTLLYGNRKGKDWFGLFNSSSGMLQEEWYGKDRYYERPEMLSLPSGSFYLSFPFKKLHNENYAFLYYFTPEEVIQAVYLCENQQVEYGFIKDENMTVISVIEEDRFQGFFDNETPIIYDFEGKIYVDGFSSNTEYSFYTGFCNDKVWLGYYNDEDNWQEIIGTETFERNRRIHLGYGEYEDFYINNINIRNLTATDWGFVFVSIYRSFLDVFCINEGMIYDYISLPLKHDGQIRNWLDENILIDKSIVLSPKAELVAEFTESVDDSDEIISMEEGIRFQYNSFSRINYAEGTTIWETGVEKLYSVPSDARIIMTVKDKGATLWLYHCDIVNLDGSRSAFEFDLNIETGEISYR